MSCPLAPNYEAFFGNLPDCAARQIRKPAIVDRDAGCEYPEVGDLNLMQYPSALAHVSQRFGAFVLESLSPLSGGFADDVVLTRAWCRRFVEPELWTP